MFGRGRVGFSWLERCTKGSQVLPFCSWNAARQRQVLVRNLHLVESMNLHEQKHGNVLEFRILNRRWRRGLDPIYRDPWTGQTFNHRQQRVLVL